MSKSRSFRLSAARSGTGTGARAGRAAAAPRFVLPTPHAFAGGKPQLRLELRALRLGQPSAGRRDLGNGNSSLLQPSQGTS